MKRICCFVILCFSVFTVYPQDCTSTSKYKDKVAVNSGVVETLDNTVGHGVYLEVSGILENEYQFTATHTNLGTPVNDYITISTASGTPLKSGTSPINYTFLNGDVPNGIIQLHYYKDASCSTEDINLTATLLNRTVSTTTCQMPESPRISYLSNSRIDFYWNAPSLGTVPSGYSWDIVLQGNDPGQVLFSGTTDASNLSASSGEVLSLGTDYDLYIYSNCAENGFSDPLGPLGFTTNTDIPPVNDLCTGALSVVQDLNVSEGTATVRQGSVENGAETNFSGENCDGNLEDNARDDLWYAFIAQTTDINIDLIPDFNGILTLFSGDCNSLNIEACSDVNKSNDPRDESIYATGLTVGHIYYFRIYSQGFSTTSPNFNFKLWSSQNPPDLDGDGYTSNGGIDCNDMDISIHPSANEIPGNSVDENCDGMYAWYQDNDGDSFGSTTIVESANSTPGMGESPLDTDCNDNEPNSYPGNTEICDGIDNDCDGEVDESFADTDNDGVADCVDNCPNHSNPDQEDTDNNGVGDVCEGLSADSFNMEDVKVVPNPFNSSLSIHFARKYDKIKIGVTLFDLNGRVIYSDYQKSQKGILIINTLSQLQKGVYLLKIYNHFGVTMKQLVKL